jgi:hypothetical protein
VTDFYRTERGITIRVTTSDDGGLNVHLLKDGAWEPAPVGMMGLRLSPGTKRLRASEIRALPT